MSPCFDISQTFQCSLEPKSLKSMDTFVFPRIIYWQCTNSDSFSLLFLVMWRYNISGLSCVVVYGRVNSKCKGKAGRLLKNLSVVFCKRCSYLQYLQKYTSSNLGSFEVTNSIERSNIHNLAYTQIGVVQFRILQIRLNVSYWHRSISKWSDSWDPGFFATKISGLRRDNRGLLKQCALQILLLAWLSSLWVWRITFCKSYFIKLIRVAVKIASY